MSITFEFFRMERQAKAAHPNHRPMHLAETPLGDFKKAVEAGHRKTAALIEDEEAKQLLASYANALKITVGALKYRHRFNKLCGNVGRDAEAKRNAFLARMEEIGQPILENKDEPT